MKLESMLMALTTCIYLVGPDEEIMEKRLRDYAAAGRIEFNTWSAYAGLNFDLLKDKNKPTHATPNEIFSYIEKEVRTELSMAKTRPIMFVLKDFNIFFKDKVLVRRLKDIILDEVAFHKLVIVITASDKTIPPELSRFITVYDYGLPTPEEMTYAITKQVEILLPSLEAKADKYKDLFARLEIKTIKEFINEIVYMVNGMTTHEAKIAIKHVLMENPHNWDDVQNLIESKVNCIKKVDTIRYVTPQVGLDDVGGLGNLKLWLNKRKQSLTPEAKAYGIPASRGALFLGVPGCGKTLISEAVAKDWGIPMIQLDVGSIMSGTVGSSEANMRQAIQIIEQTAPCVLFIDEIDKNLSGTKSSNQSDSGTLARVYGQLITWLNDKKLDIFVLATANDVSQLPPELTRRGRFDEIFYIDLPDQKEREEILSIHLRRAGRNPDDFNIRSIASELDKYSGADIAEIVTTALINAYFDKKKDIDDTDLYTAIGELTPIGITMKNKIEDILDWCNTHSVRKASLEEEQGEISEAHIIISEE